MDSGAYSRVVNRYETKLTYGSIDKWGSIIFALSFAVLFVYLREFHVTEFRETGAQFPRLLLTVGTVLCLLLIVKKVFISQPLFGEGSTSQSAMAKYLRGRESNYSLDKRIYRFVLFNLWVGLFFGLLSVNLYLALTVFYVGGAVSLGVRNVKQLTIAIVVMNAAVYLIFVQVLGVPLEVF